MAVDRTLVQIRERSFLDILDLALVVLRHRPWTIGVTAWLGIAPWAALNAWLTLGTVDGWAVSNLVLILLEAPLATGPLTIVLGGLMFGARPPASRVLLAMGRLVGPLLVYQVLLRGFLISSVVFAWIVPTRLAFLNEVILLERGRWRKVWSRCADLTRDRGGELLGQWLMRFGFGAMFVLAFRIATSRVAGVFEGELTWVRTELDQLINGWALLGVWIVVAFFAVVQFLTYIDQRIRLEGWEVEVRLRNAGRIMTEEMEAW